MPKINNNPIMKGASGMLGDVVVYRQFRGTTVMSNRPKKPKVLTPHQKAIKSSFLLAVAYAKAQIADPILKAKYEPRTRSEFTSAYIAAIADYLRKRKQHDNLLKEETLVDSKEVLDPKSSREYRCGYHQGFSSILRILPKYGWPKCRRILCLAVSLSN
jgi:signal peptidase I